jgi:hypothetical protein
MNALVTTPIPLDPFGNRGEIAKWDARAKWHDRDGVALPTAPYLILALAHGLEAWFDKRPHLVPDEGQKDDLNNAIPREKWPKDFNNNNKVKAPYEKVVVALFVNPRTGTLHRYVSPTWGALKAIALLEDQIAMARLLRGPDVHVVVTLDERPWKTSYGMSMRPHFEVVGYQHLGNSGTVEALPPPDAPQLSGPASATPGPGPAPAQPTAPVQEPRPHPIPEPATKPPSAKRPISVSDYTKTVTTAEANLPGLRSAAPLTTEELLNDSLDDMPWDSAPKTTNK